jgi:hypothetical protein
MLVFLMGTHPRVGNNSDIRILSLGRCPERPTDPLSIICSFLLKADDQASSIFAAVMFLACTPCRVESDLGNHSTLQRISN